MTDSSYGRTKGARDSPPDSLYRDSCNRRRWSGKVYSSWWRRHPWRWTERSITRYCSRIRFWDRLYIKMNIHKGASGGSIPGRTPLYSCHIPFFLGGGTNRFPRLRLSFQSFHVSAWVPCTCTDHFSKHIPRWVHRSRKIKKENGHTRPSGEVSFPVPFPERRQEQDTPSCTSGRTVRTTYTGDARFFQCFPLPCPAWHWCCAVDNHNSPQVRYIRSDNGNNWRATR